MMNTTLCPVHPIHRQREGASGTPVVLGDGETWLLADGGLCNALDTLRDRLFDDSQLAEKVTFIDIADAAFYLASANYELEADEGSSLILGADRKILTDAVMIALFGPDDPQRTYTNWVASSFMANGIDPASVPVHLRALVLDQLVALKRAVPAGQFIDSVVAARRFRAVRHMAEAQATDRAAKPPPEGSP